MTASLFQSRIKKTTQALKKADECSSLVVSTAPFQVRSGDTLYPYRQSSNFFYLTGSYVPEMMLCLSSFKEPVLIGKPVSTHTILWDGPRKTVEEIAEILGIESISTEAPVKAAHEYTKNHERLYADTGYSESLSAKLAFELFQHSSPTTPSQFHSIDEILGQLRLFKSPQEIKAIKRACAITVDSLKAVLPLVRSGISERQIAIALHYEFAQRDAYPGFETIIGAGASAATLHYTDLGKQIQKNDLVLIDCGAEHHMYSGDISRTLSAGGIATEWQQDLHAIVLEAQKAAIAKVKHGVKIKTVYDAATKVLAQGLVDLGVLKGPVSQVISEKLYKKWFPHSIGHSLGIDVHDTGGLRGNNNARLEASMVFTVEPGLYFRKKVRKIPPCGIRIEDDVLVTKKGCEILTAGIPKDLDKINSLV